MVMGTSKETLLLREIKNGSASMAMDGDEGMGR
eukprot:CAMPEP_0169478092 /NCGR_PEP_ID=MMETSP1042-20121227/28283_1 /TAXON_ID=464988 /ORGANISM="Hemiselmis andersenii, Strain CCMP1180" /LENGTH=32 /DNA_ID= /DNA_START= /DNA_END= /DNA_ORIENTATION=